MTSGSFRRHSLIQNNHGGKGGGRGGKSEGRKVIPLTRARHRTGPRRRPARGARRCPTLEFPESSSLPLALPHALPGEPPPPHTHARRRGGIRGLPAPRSFLLRGRGAAAPGPRRARRSLLGAGPRTPPGQPPRAGEGVPGMMGGNGPPVAKDPARLPAGTGGSGRAQLSAGVSACGLGSHSFATF